MTEKLRESLDIGGTFGALLNDLSKAFDCLPHEFLIAKRQAYGFDMKPLKVIHNHLSNRK